MKVMERKKSPANINLNTVMLYSLAESQSGEVRGGTDVCGE